MQAKTTGEREIAVRGLAEIFEKKSYSNVAMRRILGQCDHLSRTQKAFVTEIISGCIRNLMHIDYIINSFSSTPTTRMKLPILNVLRISVYQMKFMDKVPVFAICNEAVDLTKKMGFALLSGFVNGVLRNIARKLSDLKPPTSLHIRYSCNEWIVNHFVRELGQAAAEDLLDSTCRPPGMTLCVNTNRISVDGLTDVLEQEGVEVSRGKLVKDALIVSKTADIAGLESFRRGLYHVMDEAAMLAAKHAVRPGDRRIIDLCAAPGGKSFLAAYLAPEAQILAGDVHDFKLDLLKEGARRLGLDNVAVRKRDATVFNEELRDLADLAIVDAPCSGLGTLRRRPDIKLFKDEDSIDGLVALQQQILANSWEYVVPGGRLLYSTCTISQRENMDNVNWFLRNFPFRLIRHTQILPQHYNTDGFFIAVFERVE